MNSSSYIKIVCADNVNPKFNRIELRTTPPTYIELQAGENILTVEEYPDLKYGFKQDETIHPNVRCEDVIEIDFSHFDARNLVTMEDMFNSMRAENIIFGNMCTPNLKNCVRAFSSVGIHMREYMISELDISSFDFESVDTAMAMFQGANIISLRMENAKLNNLKNGRNMLRHCMIQTLILDGLEISDPNIIGIELYGPLTVSLKRCKPEIVRGIIESIENKRISNGKWIPAQYILDNGLKYTLEKTPNGKVECILK